MRGLRPYQQEAVEAAKRLVFRVHYVTADAEPGHVDVSADNAEDARYRAQRSGLRIVKTKLLRK